MLACQPRVSGRGWFQDWPPSHPCPCPGCSWRAEAGPDPLWDSLHGATVDVEWGHAGEGWTQLLWAEWRVAVACVLPFGPIGKGAPRKSPPACLATALAPVSGDGVPRTVGAGPGQHCVWSRPHPPDLWDQGPGPGTQGVGQPSAGREQRAGRPGGVAVSWAPPAAGQRVCGAMQTADGGPAGLLCFRWWWARGSQHQGALPGAGPDLGGQGGAWWQAWPRRSQDRGLGGARSRTLRGRERGARASWVGGPRRSPLCLSMFPGQPHSG